MGHTYSGAFRAGIVLLSSFVATLSHMVFAATENASAKPAAVASASSRFGHASAWVVGIEGLAGLTFHWLDNTEPYTDENGDPHEWKSTMTTVSFVALRPKVGLDVFVIDHVSVGLGADYSVWNDSTKSTNDAGSTWSGQTSHFIDVVPRVGIAYSSDSGLGVWARGGLAIRSQWEEVSPAPPGFSGANTWTAFDAVFEVLGTFPLRRDIMLDVGPYITKTVASSASTPQGIALPEDQPPTLGLTLGAALVL